MKLSRYHKNKGDEVSFQVPDPDKIYVSCVFTKNAWKARGVHTLYRDAEVQDLPFLLEPFEEPKHLRAVIDLRGRTVQLD